MYSYENYHKVKSEIEKRRLDAVAAAEARSEELRARVPEIRKIDEELGATGMLIFRTAINGGDLGAIRSRNEALQKRRRELIVSLGLPEDYTDVKYHCKKCSDSGYIDTKMCSCMREELVKATIASSGIGNLIKTQSFENFRLDYYEYDPKVYDAMRRNLDGAISYVTRFPERHGQLLMIGKTGTGKTHLSTAIARALIERGYDVIYDSVQNILADFEREKFRSGYSEEESRTAKYFDCDLLIIDDLGTEFQTAFTVSCLYNILTTRQNSNKGIIISTNYTPEEIRDKYEDRIYSRLIGRGVDILPFYGKDRRVSK